MNVNKGLLFLLTLVVISTTMFSQANLLNATIPEEIGVKTDDQLAADNDKPLPYGYVDDRDILWSKMVWEYIDLNEKINLPYYYPADTSNIDSNRRSLFDTLLRGIKNGDIVDFYDDSYFTEKLTLEDIEDRLHKKELTDAGVEAKNFGEEVTEDMYDIRDLQSADIQGFRIKGLYYFDKRQGELKYRLLGIAPISPDVNFIDSMDEPGDMTELIPLFWVWYPGVRDIMHDMKVFNSKNSAFPLSYDLILNARRFNAFIYREANVYGNRDIKDYIKNNSLFQVQESTKIKNQIRDYELDMWNY